METTGLCFKQLRADVSHFGSRDQTCSSFPHAYIFMVPNLHYTRYNKVIITKLKGVAEFVISIILL